ncbi:MAG: ABC transporter ATP-binding protein [Oscillospiraceae bacterium]|nr:ABC transporter ATP-binding protein [Oscillospiraceae bacterium]
MAILTVTAIEMKYSGNHALRGIDMAINPGEIVGLLGPNASGKTTLMKIIAGLLQPTRGDITYPDNATRGINSKRKISFLPDSFVFPGYMRVKDTFGFYKDMYPDYLDRRAEEMTELLGLAPVMDTRLHKLSKGMQERVSLALTFCRQTKLYLLDEPLGGIDPMGKSKIIDAILSMQLEDSSIVISTHLVKDIERIFDSVYFISQGRIISHGDCDKMREETGKTVEQTYLEVFENEIYI